MTEYEINKAVAHKLVKPFYGTEMFDPCNDAKQAWEVMLANNICVLNVGDNYVAFNVKGKSVDRHKLDAKPFVAAMLLFLEI
ncbi:hypothetical protein [Proteus phage vB_PmiP_RS51pmB]|nr:hypothetical protein [Proteus phage vB_PmiP_RS51pmB]